MKSTIKAFLTITLITLATACGTGKKERDGALGDKKVELQKLKTEREKLDGKITSVENEIAKLDTSAEAKQIAKLVAITPITKGDFKHYLDLQGSVDSKNIAYITPTGQPGQIKAIYVKEGDNIRKGQLILKLDNSVAIENVNAIRTQMSSVKAQLDLAKSVYNRQKNLWDQHIGTEVQLLQAKTNVEALQGQLRSIQANVNAAQTQANQANVYSNVSGTVDEVTAHVGETFNGNPAAGGYIKIVSNSALKIRVIVPENNAGKIHKGTPVVVEIPDLNKTFNTTISFISQSVGATTRGVTAEATVPAGMDLRPNQIAIVKLLDYTAPNSLAIPLNTLQTDENGKFVLVASKEGNELIARKRTISVGQLYGDKIEVKQGLKEGDELVTDGYQGLFDGQLITTSVK
ncbi:MAG: efflux RND transporter periplasmic adaptor subunit [Ginsengibacter sp.]|jgi:RND family efflux transporter MFP subunit